MTLLGAGGTAGAATPKASYPLEGSRASQLAGAPDLADIGPGNRFVTERIDGVARQVLAFPRGGGLSLPTAGLVDPSNHTIVMTFRLADVSDIRRLLDFSAGASDAGLYSGDGSVILYAGRRDLDVSADTVLGSSYAQVTVTNEATLVGLRWTVVYVNGIPVAAATTGRGLGLGSGVLRFFKDNVRGRARGEESGGALTCVLVYDGALTPGEVGQVAGDPARCPAPPPTAPENPPFEPAEYVGTTSQRLPISFTVTATSVEGVSFRWRARCADGRVHSNRIVLGATQIRGGRFSVERVLGTGGRARVTGTLAGARARGTLSRWGDSAFGTACSVRGIRWRASARFPTPSL